MTSLYFREWGSGRPLVFIHGFCETSEVWQEFVPPLSKEFRVIAIDLPGFGNSPLIPAPFSIDQVADQVYKWLQENKIERPIVIGHSLGGYVTLSLAARYENLIEGLVLFHSTTFPDTEEKKQNRNKVIEFVTKNGVAPFVDTFVPGLFFDKEHSAISTVYSIAIQTKKETITAYLAAMRDRPDRSDVLEKSVYPALVIAGAEDTLIPAEANGKMDKMGQKAEFHSLENTGHMGFFEAKEVTRQIVLQFSKRVFFDK
ncbi:MAG: alpha/beta hydrolase [Cyclobacteriaceae bacterium]|nr:alpha/beta hydrolase [Cyclobacteriaceae bacterium]